jgi:hypothetical protein
MDVPLQYLGIIILHNKVKMDPVKITGVIDWPMPLTCSYSLALSISIVASSLASPTLCMHCLTSP